MTSAGFVSAFGLLFVSFAPAAAPQADAAPAACLRSWPEVRYGNAGYDHVVVISNACEQQATCEVSSNVNPERSRVVVAARATQEVLTMRGSPAREFTPRVECRLTR